MGAQEEGSLVEYLYGVESDRWHEDGGIPEDLIGWCRCWCGIAIGGHVMNLLNPDVEFRDVQIDGELDGGTGDDCVDSHDKHD